MTNTGALQHRGPEGELPPVAPANDTASAAAVKARARDELPVESVLAEQTGLHRIVVVGGGAGGLELATQLGDKLGRRKKAHVTLIEKKRTHFWKPHLHEIAAGSMDLGVYETNYLAQAHWHSFRYRIGEMIGLERVPRALNQPEGEAGEGQDHARASGVARKETFSTGSRRLHSTRGGAALHSRPA